MTPEFQRGFQEELEKIAFSVEQAVQLARRGKEMIRKLSKVDRWD